MNWYLVYIWPTETPGEYYLNIPSHFSACKWDCVPMISQPSGVKACKGVGSRVPMEVAQFITALLMHCYPRVGEYQRISESPTYRGGGGLRSSVMVACGGWDENVRHHVHHHPCTTTHLCFPSHPALNDHDLKVPQLAHGSFLCVGGCANGGHHVWYYSNVVRKHEHDPSCICFVMFCWENYIYNSWKKKNTQHSAVITVFWFILIPFSFFARNSETEIPSHNFSKKARGSSDCSTNFYSKGLPSSIR